MADSQYDPFPQEATTGDPACVHAPRRDRLHGRYTSRCFLSQTAPAQKDAFRTAMNKKRIHPQRIGLRMNGPVAASSVPASYPGLV